MAGCPRSRAPRPRSPSAAGYILAVLASIFSALSALTTPMGSAVGDCSKAPSVLTVRLAWGTLLAIAAAVVELASMVTPWRSLTYGPAARAGAGLSASAEMGLYSSTVCQTRHFAAAAAAIPPAGTGNFASVTGSEPLGLPCQFYATSNLAYADVVVVGPPGAPIFPSYVYVVGAFAAATMAVAVLSAAVAIGVATRVTAGDAAALSSTSLGALTPTAAFWGAVATTALSCFTWPIFAAFLNFSNAAIPGDSTKPQWVFSSGFVLSIVAGILAYGAVVAFYLALAALRATPHLADWVIAFATPFLRRRHEHYHPVHAHDSDEHHHHHHLAHGEAADPKAAPASPAAAALPAAPKAAAKRLAAVRSAAIAAAVCGAAFGALFGTWEWQGVWRQSFSDTGTGAPTITAMWTAECVWAVGRARPPRSGIVSWGPVCCRLPRLPLPQ